ncbi:MAG TPA: HigA family addiction module antitoxin [Burkholderiales bacterium]|nr:HigA family addiction module antitoxin [Burkholderiales bacterium]
MLGKRGITAGTALRLAHYFGISPQFWMNLQAKYDLQTEEDRMGTKVKNLKVLKAA